MNKYIEKYIKFFKHENYNIYLIIKINILFLLFFMSYDSMTVTIPLYINNLKVGVSYYGTIMAITLIIRGLIAIPISHLEISNKFKILNFVMLINLLTLIILMLVENFILTFLGFIVFLSSVSVLNVIVNPILASISPKDNYGISFGIRDIFLFSGSAIGLFITGIIKKLSDYQNIFLFNLILLIFIIILIFIIKRDFENLNFYKEKSKSLNENNSSKQNLNIKEKLKKNLSFIKNDKNFIYYCIVCSLLTIATTGLTYIPLIAKEYNISEQNIYNAMSTSLIISALLSILGGKIIDKNNKKKVYLLYIFMLFISYICFGLNNKGLFLLGMFIYSLTVALDNISQVYFFSIFENNIADKYFGIISSLTLIIGSISRQISGYIWDINFNYIIQISTLLMFITLIISYFKLNEINEEPKLKRK
ncbi:MFS transporter [Clostridium perfringens]|nr:MFS transporter [Clostridium perfringens]EJT5932282.1 MFS transporter [Clostridium perfringens]EJT6163548.1 MFS transporter [Clostridium perfringens]MDM0633807.1 MFS transporter [Clostridium perfringens]MDM0701913.1 MFS transporter [Clostridium perfringens]MDO6234190.1 MFS transporter [Clostridium perfringens]